MRVLLVTDWMTAPGGAEGYALVIRAGLLAAGDEVRLLTSNAGSAANGTADFVAYGATTLAAQSVLQIINPFAARTVQRAVREFRPDVALVHLFAYHLSPAILWALGPVPAALMVLDYKIICPLGTKLLPDGMICTRNAGAVCQQSGCLSLAHWLRDYLRYQCIARAMTRPKLVMACSRHMQGELRSNGIDAEHVVLPVAAPSEAFARRPAVYPSFVSCGRLSREKGLPLLVRAFARVHARMRCARLTICGDGPLRHDVENAVRAHGVEGSVTVTGWLDQAGVDRHLESAWALVAPATWAEPFGQVGPEAIVRGVPVIASRTGGFSETVEEGVSGLLHANGDEDGLVDALQRVASGAVFPNHVLDAHVIARASEAHSIERHIRQIRTLLGTRLALDVSK